MPETFRIETIQGPLMIKAELDDDDIGHFVLDFDYQEKYPTTYPYYDFCSDRLWIGHKQSVLLQLGIPYYRSHWRYITKFPYEIESIDAEEVEYAKQDILRYRDYLLDGWHYQVMEARLYLFDEQIDYASLGGIESDCSEAHRLEIYNGLKHELMGNIARNLDTFIEGIELRKNKLDALKHFIKVYAE